jgi:hypothetical protein
MKSRIYLFALVTVVSFGLQSISCKSDASQAAATEAQQSTETSAAAKQLSPVEKMQMDIAGNWRSESDPKSRLAILQNQFVSIYDGKIVGEDGLQLHEKCPESCSGATGACFVLTSKDGTTTCYAIVQADGKKLVYSQIGGTGNTLTYARIQ